MAPASAAPPVKQGQYCDVGQTSQMGCGYCNLVYQYVGGPLTSCAANVMSLILHSGCYTKRCISVPSAVTTPLVQVDDESAAERAMSVDSHAA